MVLGIYAIRDIQINDEITINYDWIKLASEGLISK
jgi:SET domain-containing protein